MSTIQKKTHGKFTLRWINTFGSHLEDELMVSMAPGSDADYERSECSTDLRKRHPHGRYQTDTGGQKTDNKKIQSVFPHHD